VGDWGLPKRCLFGHGKLFQRHFAAVSVQVRPEGILSYGETPNGHWWNVLYGLAGYTREGTATTVLDSGPRLTPPSHPSGISAPCAKMLASAAGHEYASRHPCTGLRSA
jgi:hypothetical protein